MKKKVLVVLLLVFCGFFAVTARADGQKWAVVINSSDKEMAWNAMRIAKFALTQRDSVSVFLLGQGVKTVEIDDDDFNVKEILDDFSKQGGNVHACGACLKLHEMKPSEACPIGTLKILYNLIHQADKVLIF